MYVSVRPISKSVDIQKQTSGAAWCYRLLVSPALNHLQLLIIF